MTEAEFRHSFYEIKASTAEVRKQQRQQRPIQGNFFFNPAEDLEKRSNDRGRIQGDSDEVIRISCR